jgi:hypothetical protein
MTQLTNDIEPKIETLGAFKLKNVVAGRGHDCGGLICDVYFKNKKLIDYHDDGWGGEPELTYLTDTAEQEISVYLKENNYAQIMFDGGWQFMKSVDKIDMQTQIVDVIEAKANLIDQEKFEKKIQKACKRGIVFGTKNSFREFGWKKIKDLNELLRYPNGLKALQDTYDRAKKEDGEILNNKEELKRLGVVL